VTDHFVRIYNDEAAAYHELIAAEDADHNLLPALQSLAPLAGARQRDLGSGSGRNPLLLRGLGCEIVAAELHRGMLVEQKRQQRLVNGDWALVQADGRSLPLQAGWADIVIAGWAFGHFTGWYPDDWRQHAARAVAEMQRAAKPSGSLIILETLGTGALQPAPPNDALASYYAWLEGEHGFVRTTVATDYDFGGVERAAKLCGFFFGAEMAERVRVNGWSRVPEWTGVWHRATK
jgi:SAM-dependent methyltransferase